jgi:xanthine/uracil permease
MFLPAEYQYLEPTVIAAGVVFVVALLGNILSFSNRFVNALVTAILFGAIFGGLAYVTKVGPPPGAQSQFLPPEYLWLELVLVASAVVFVVDLIGNILSFSNRFLSAIVTAIVFAVIFGGLTHVAYKEGIAIPTTQELTPTPAPETAPAPAP